ncbi:MAG: hypothetical protein AAFW46_01810 [Pseudomonadota bacterium]
MSTQTFVLIELALVFGGILLFGWHQIRSVRDRDPPAEDRARPGEEKGD